MNDSEDATSHTGPGEGGEAAGVERPIEMTAVAELPADFRCLWCGYDVGGSATWRCPECGREFHEVDIATGKARHRAERSAVTRFLAWGVVLAGVFIGSVLVGLFTRLGYWSGIVVWVLSALAMVGVYMAGSGACLLARSGVRRQYLWVWTRVQIRVHAGWLAALVGTGVLVPAGMLVRAMDVVVLTQAFRAGMLLGLAMWGIASIGAGWSWRRAMRRRMHDLDLAPGGARNMMMVCGWALMLAAWVCAACMGLAGAAVVARVSEMNVS